MVKENLKKTKMRNGLAMPVVVAGAGFRYLAFRDSKGKLRNFWNQTLVPLPVHILDGED